MALLLTAARLWTCYVPYYIWSQIRHAQLASAPEEEEEQPHEAKPALGATAATGAH